GEHASRQARKVARKAAGRGAGRINLEAGVVHAAPGVHTAAVLNPRAQPRIQRDVEEVVDARHLPEVVCLRDDAIDLTELRQRDVVQAADLVPAAAGQPWIT